MIDLDEVWKQYPYPRSGHIMISDIDDGNNHYCVGGALCLYVKCDVDIEDMRFPTEYELEAVLENLNPGLTSATKDFAGAIVVCNDGDDFDGARRLVKEALEYKNEEV